MANHEAGREGDGKIASVRGLDDWVLAQSRILYRATCMLLRPDVGMWPFIPIMSGIKGEGVNWVACKSLLLNCSNKQMYWNGTQCLDRTPPPFKILDLPWKWSWLPSQCLMLKMLYYLKSNNMQFLYFSFFLSHSQNAFPYLS